MGIASPLFLFTRGERLGTGECPPDLLAYDRRTARFHLFEDAAKEHSPKWWKRRLEFLHSSLKLDKPRFKKSLVNIHLVLPEKARPVQDWPWNDLIREVLGYPGISFLQWGRDGSGKPVLRSLSGEDLRFALCHKPSQEGSVPRPQATPRMASPGQRGASKTESEHTSTLSAPEVPAAACAPDPAALAEVVAEKGAKENLSKIAARISAAPSVRIIGAAPGRAAESHAVERPESVSGEQHEVAVRVSPNGAAALAVGASIPWGSLLRFLVFTWIGLKVAVALYRAAGVM